jgi:carbonic anhydrase/acetyltransferase-like protein (isoleucine patch superfamily)
MLRTFDGAAPEVAETAYVDPSAVVVGDVEIGERATVLPGAVLRGDLGSITLREGANVQDNATVHADTPDAEVVFERYGAAGHNAVVHNAHVGARALVGMHATVLDGATLEPRSVVAAGSVVLEGTTVPSRTLVGGTPAEELRADLPGDAGWFDTGEHYAALAERYAASETVRE